MRGRSYRPCQERTSHLVTPGGDIACAIRPVNLATPKKAEAGRRLGRSPWDRASEQRSRVSDQHRQRDLSQPAFGLLLAAGGSIGATSLLPRDRCSPGREPLAPKVCGHSQCARAVPRRSLPESRRTIGSRPFQDGEVASARLAAGPSHSGPRPAYPRPWADDKNERPNVTRDCEMHESNLNRRVHSRMADAPEVSAKGSVIGVIDRDGARQPHLQLAITTWTTGGRETTHT